MQVRHAERDEYDGLDGPRLGPLTIEYVRFFIRFGGNWGPVIAVAVSPIGWRSRVHEN